MPRPNRADIDAHTENGAGPLAVAPKYHTVPEDNKTDGSNGELSSAGFNVGDSGGGQGQRSRRRSGGRGRGRSDRGRGMGMGRDGVVRRHCDNCNDN